MQDTRDKFTIGRDRNCDIAIADETVSSRHAEISFLGDGRLLLTDCRSSNGTFRQLADGTEARVRQELISPLDQLRFGNVRIGVRELLEALRMKYPNFGASSSQPPRRAMRATSPRELERCECGRIKPVGEPCPGCGA